MTSDRFALEKTSAIVQPQIARMTADSLAATAHKDRETSFAVLQSPMTRQGASVRFVLVETFLLERRP